MFRFRKPQAYGPLHLTFLVLVAVGLGLLAGCGPKEESNGCTTVNGNVDCPVQGPVKQDPAMAPAAGEVPMDTPGMNTQNMDPEPTPSATTPLPTANPTNPSEGLGYPGTGGGGGGAPNPRPTCWDGSLRRAVTPYCPPEPTPSETP